MPDTNKTNIGGNSSNQSSKTVVLFSTRFLEEKAGLFRNAEIVEQAFHKNEKYCDFFLNNADNKIRFYLFDQYMIPRIKELFHNIPPEVSSFNELAPHLKSINPNLFGEIRKNRSTGTPYEFTIEQTDATQEPLQENSPKYVQNNELVKYLTSCTNDVVKQMKLDIDYNSDSQNYEIGWRFKLYKLKLAENQGDYSAYAVWSLNEEKVKDHNEYEWFEALCKEVEVQESNISIEIYLFLHDKDITSSTFKVLYYKKRKQDKNFSFLPDGVKLNVAVFQHNDEIGRILKTEPSDDRGKIKLLEDACNEIEKGGKLPFLNALSDFVSYWHDGGKEEYFKKVKEKDKYGISSLITHDEANVKAIYEIIYEEINKLQNKTFI